MASTAIDLQAAQGTATAWSVAEYVTSLTAALLDAARPGDQVALIVSPFEPVPDPILGAAERTAASVDWVPLPLPAPASTGDDRMISAAYDALPLAGADYLGMGPLELLRSATTCGPPAAPAWARRVALLIHDLTPALMPDCYLDAFSDYEQRYRRRLGFCAEADVLGTATEYLASQVPYCLGRTRVVPHAIGLAPPATEQDGPEWEAPRPAERRTSVVYAYDPAPQRRPELLVEAAGRLPAGISGRLELVFITAPDQGRRLRDEAVARGVSPEMVKVVPASPLASAGRSSILAALCGALAYAVPSCSEGYDLAALGAPLLGTPVLVPDIAGGSGWEGGFDPTDAGSLAVQLERLLSGDGYRDGLLDQQARRARQGSWEAVAAQVWRLLGTGAAEGAEGKAARRGQPPRIAVTGPLPPIPSGISKYIEDQTRAVAGRVSVDWVRSPDSPGPGAGGGGPQVLDPGEVRSGGLWWHHMANQRRFHFHQFQLIEARGGVVELHDVALPFVIPPVLVPPPGVTMPADLHDELSSVYRDREPSYLEAEDAGIGVMLRWFARHSRALVVHSGQARDMVRRHVPGSDLDLFVVPLGMWMSAESRLLALSRRIPLPDRPYVVVPGFVGPAKWPEGVIAAVGRIPAGSRPLLVFAGMCPPHLEAKLHQEARQRNVDLIITGFVSSQDFDTWLARAVAAVIGRLVIRGETSGTVQRATRMGTPTIVAASGAFSELPDDVPLLSVVDLAPSALAARLVEVLGSPSASPSSPERKDLFAASLDALRHAFSWEPTVELMESLAGGTDAPGCN
ncbi:MAG TPA: hypothetical protein VFH58_01310 [Acidimicrobiales bacterium]|nr:hypothetical protein [Acidimicrobiales bacterium]